MSKKNDDAFDAFLADVLASVDSDKRAAVEETLKSNPKVRDGVLARADYSRSMDNLKAREAEVEATLTEANKRIAGWNSWYTDASKEHADTIDRLKTYEETYGPLDAETKEKMTKTKTFSEEDFNKKLTEELNKHDTAAISFANDLFDVKLDYFTEFKEKLDTDELIKFATEKQIPLKVAYREYTAPKVNARLEEKYKADIAAAKVEGAREALSNHRMPTLSSHTEPHPIDLNLAKDQPRVSTDRIAAAVAGWNKAQAG